MIEERARDFRLLVTLLVAATSLVSLLGLAAELAYALLDLGEWGLRAVRFLSLSAEGNLPTWYSSALLLIASLQLAAIARQLRGDQTRSAHWWGLAVGFAYLSLDEATEIHEGWSGYFDTSGLLYFGWVIPAALLVVIAALIFLPFLYRLPRWARIGFIIAGAVYVGGAVGIELPLGVWVERHGSENLTYALIDWLEETLEMAGASLFLVLLARYRWQEVQGER